MSCRIMYCPDDGCWGVMFLLQELNYLNGAVNNPVRPFVAIVGGSKVSTKIDVLESLLAKVDKLIIGGGMVFTFLAAKGLGVGSSLFGGGQDRAGKGACGGKPRPRA
eukprot:jgi/Botrbrau1/22383/Bobra.0474s0001.1